MTGSRAMHPLVALMRRRLGEGACRRREFLRTVTLLGVGSGAAYAMAGSILGERMVDPAQAEPSGRPVKGGTLRCSMSVQEMTDPALFDWTEKSNVARQIVEYLTMTGPDNVTRPHLAESWDVSDDLRVWTLHLRRDVTWHNGDAFDVEDVLFNFRRWLDPKTGSSNQGLFIGLTEEYETGESDADGKPAMGRRMREGALERVDDYTLRLHFSQPVLSVPENLYSYPCAIVHRSFEETGADLSKNPLGTGAFTLVEFEVGRKAVLRRVPDIAYWGPEVHLDEIVYVDHGPASAAQLAAFASDQVDMTYDLDVSSLPMAESLPEGVIHETVTAQTACVRMRVDAEPFSDARVRRAIQACVDEEAYPRLIYRGRAAIGEHHHVAPIHPEYFALPRLARDPEKARALLAEAGHGDGLQLSVDCGNTNGPWQQQALEILKEQLAPAGIELVINMMPPEQYWEIWNKTPFGITSWAHRPLGTMTLSLGYRSGVAWNETGYANPAFDAALDEAEALVDPKERARVMEKVERILQEDAVIVQPIWLTKFFMASPRIKGLAAHPMQHHEFHGVWIDEAA